MFSRILSCLLICLSALQARAAEPRISFWADGMDAAYAVGLHQQGYPILPVFRLPAGIQQNGPSYNAAYFSQETLDALKYVSDNDLPLTLRHHNIESNFKQEKYRLPKVWESIPISALRWRIHPTTLELDDLGGAPDTFGPPHHWAGEGLAWAQSVWMNNFVNACPSPGQIYFLCNNESGVEEYNLYTAVAPGTKPIDNIRVWKPLEDLKFLSIRMRDKVAELGVGSNPADFFPTFESMQHNLYHTLLDSYTGNFPTAWQGKDMVTSGYGNPLETKQYDGYSPGVYWGHQVPVIATQLRHLEHVSKHLAEQLNREAKEPRVLREFSISLYDSAPYKGAELGEHAAIDPDSYKGYIDQLLWYVHEPNTNVVLRHWYANQTKPTTPFFPETIRTNVMEKLALIGRPELIDLTHHDYIIPTCEAAKQIRDHNLLRKYWEQGKAVTVAEGLFPRMLNVDVNTSRAQWPAYDGQGRPTGKVNDAARIVVWAQMKELTGNPKKLLIVWQPKDLTVEPVIDGIGPVPIARHAYYLWDGTTLEPLPPSVDEPEPVPGEVTLEMVYELLMEVRERVKSLEAR